MHSSKDKFGCLLIVLLILCLFYVVHSETQLVTVKKINMKYNTETEMQKQASKKQIQLSVETKVRNK